MMRPSSLLALALTLIPFAPAAQAQTANFTPQQLDQMAKERQQELGPRNWGPPPTVTAKPVRLYPTPVPVFCASPAHEYEPIFAEPSAHSKQIGIAGPQIAATHDLQGGWRKVLRVGNTFGWMPDADIRPYHALPGTTPSRCTVSGETNKGWVMFNHTPL